MCKIRVDFSLVGNDKQDLQNGLKELGDLICSFAQDTTSTPAISTGNYVDCDKVKELSTRLKLTANDLDKLCNGTPPGFCKTYLKSNRSFIRTNFPGRIKALESALSDLTHESISLFVPNKKTS